MNNTSPSNTNTTPEWSREKFFSVVRNRLSGFYETEDTRDEALVSWKDLEDSDLGITIRHASGVFQKFNNSELKAEMKNWRKHKCSCKDYNVKQLTLKDDTPVWCFVIQPPEKDLHKMGFSPLGIAHGLLVSGYCYFVKNKDICDKVVAYLK